MLTITVFFAAFVYCAAAHSLDTFQPNCTLPAGDKYYWYVSAPNVRGSWQLIWTCLFTLYVCTYQVIHLNIPPIVKDKGFLESQLWKTCKWTVVTLIAPEFILVDSWATLDQARKSLSEVRTSLPPKDRQLSEQNGSSQQSDDDDDAPDEWTLTHMFYANMGGLVIRSKTAGDLTVSANLIPSCFWRGLLGRTPPISAEDIRDKSKDSSFAKIIAIGQILFFCVQFFARVQDGLPIAQLELSVASITAYSVASYLCLWHKPKGVERPTIVLCDGDDDDVAAMAVKEVRGFKQQIWSLGTAYRESSGAEGGTANAIWFVITSMPLGAIHLSGWNLDFPTTVDMWLWRVSSIMATAFAPLLFWMGLDAVLFEHIRGLYLMFLMLTFTVLAAFLAARLILIVETIRCLFFLPAKSFLVASWTNSVPYFG